MIVPIKKALTFRASSIGDCLMGKYLLENVHAQFPQARCGIVIAGHAEMIRDLFAAYPWIEVIEANRRNPHSLLSLWKNFHGSDLVVTQYAGKHGGSFGFSSKIFARILAKHGGLIGFLDASKWNKLFYSRLLSVRLDRAVVDHEREVLRAAGVPVSLPFPTLECVQDDLVLAKFNVEAGKYIIVHFFAGGKGRSISPEKSRELLMTLRKTLPKDISLLVSGSSADRDSALALSEGLETKVIAGDASLQEMMNLIIQSRGVVSVDTGVAHITAQLGKTLIVMRTCLGPNWWFPEQYGKDAPITVFSHDATCAGGHIAKDYSDCINAIDMKELAMRAATVLA